MEFIYVILALAVAVGAYFLFFRKKEEPALPAREQPAPTKQKSERAQAKAESVKSKVAQPVSADAEAAPTEQPEGRRSTRPPPPSRRAETTSARVGERPSTAPKRRDVSSLRRGLAKSREA